MRQDVHVRLNPRLASAEAAFNNKKKKVFFQEQIGLKFKKSGSEVLHLEHNFVRC